MGLTWELRASSNSVSRHTPLIKVGDKHLRCYFAPSAGGLRQFNLEYRAFYCRKYNEISKFQYKCVLVLAARKLVLLVHALLTTNVRCGSPRSLVYLHTDAALQC